MTIAFIHPHKAFLPEVDIYIDFFSKYKIKTIVAKPEEANKIKTDVEWHFMGIDRQKKKPGVIKIHEYASASAPPFDKLKNFSKKLWNAKPDYQLFLNEYVRTRLGFNDRIPFGYRDMGVSDSFLHFDSAGVKKEFDFIYAGSVNAERKIEPLLQHFATKDLKNQTLLILSKDYDSLKNKFSPYPNIHFAGPVLHDEVPMYISKARFAINFIIDKAPFNGQTSTKLLEYAAMKIPIITTDYPWARNFQKEAGGDFFYIDKEFSNLNPEAINTFSYSFPKMASRTWENEIRKSGIVQFLHSKFPEISS